MISNNIKYNKPYYDNVTVKSESVCSTYLQFLLNSSISLSKMKIIDLGCADGKFLELLYSNNTCFGCDVSNYIVEKAKKRLPSLTTRLETCDLNIAIPSFNKNYDLITMFDVIEHLSNFIPLRTFVTNNLKSGGHFVVTTPNSNSLLRFINTNTFTGEVDPTHTMLFTPYTLDFFLRRLGLVKVVLFTPYSFLFAQNYFTEHIPYGGQIFAIYKKV